jgi:oligopeptide transport system ATP-binding protein
MSLLEVRNLATYFHTRNGVVRAVDGISYQVKPGETLGIVGESGSGKSVSQYTLLGLIPMPPGRIESGEAIFDGIDLLKATPKQLSQIRGKRISMIFQDPMTCLNPYMTIGDQLIEPLLIHEKISKTEALKKAAKILEEVGIFETEKRLNAYPHQFSGGMRQRVMIAMALITQPELLIADEPTTALDVTVQAQILELIKKLQKQYRMAVIFITHDLGVIAGMSNTVAVMYAGKIVEYASTEAIFTKSLHPYTQALLQSIPSTHKVGEKLFTIPGLPPNLTQEIPGCPFAPRCREAVEICRQKPVHLQPLFAHTRLS